MNKSTLIRTTKLAHIFTLEQLREPISLLWTLISPSALFYLLNHRSSDLQAERLSYIEATSWFYSYIALTVALFGMAFYIIGRRESGFIRSFIYSKQSKTIFLMSHLICYSATAMLYCITFYLITKPGFGEYSASEAGNILLKFYVCFIGYCSPALLLANSKLKFQTANTIISVIIFSLILSALISSNSHGTLIESVNTVNLFLISKNIISDQLPLPIFIAVFAGALTVTFLLTSKNLKINPVWSRY